MSVSSMNTKPRRPNEEPYAGKLLVRFREGLGRQLPGLLNRISFIVIYAALAVLPVYSQHDSSSLLFPEHLIYEGAFRLEPGSGVDYQDWGYAGYGIAYYPHGDANGPNDGYPGSLFGSSHPYRPNIAEVEIPVPVISPDLDIGDLPVARFVQPFVNPFSNLPNYNNCCLYSLVYLPAQGPQTSGKLYACLGYIYGGLPDRLFLAWLNPDLSNPNVAGFWRLGESKNECRFLFEIPQVWADSHVNGRILGVGDGSVWDKIGEFWMTCAPWNEGNPPASGATLAQFDTLIRHVDAHRNKGGLFPGVGSEERGGAWLTRGNRSAIVTCSDMSFSLMRDYFNGSFGPGNYPTLLFYDPNDIADVVAGAKETWEPVWHARKNLAHYYFGRDLQKPMGGDESIEDMRDAQAAGGLAFDRERGKLYVAQRRGPDYQTFIHVFQIDTSVSVSTQACAAIPVFGNLAAYPNPFNAEVSIAVSFREHGLVSGIESLPLSIYNIKGQCVCRTLPLRNRMDKNSVHYVWHASGYPSGIYIIEVCQKGRRTTAFVTLVK